MSDNQNEMEPQSESPIDLPVTTPAAGGGGGRSGAEFHPSFAGGGDGDGHDAFHVEAMYRDWFLEYASYVILDRAVPAIEDGLKPVQRRILHALNELDDGRFNKAANVIGHTMRYHPHGDAAIQDAMVKLGQKELLIDTQGNWGNVATGDSAAAPRYIEARLSKLAKAILFQADLTEWLPSYDGRNKEPKVLPVKFPLLLNQGVEGIAVGLATKILPHNFIELIKASVAVLKGKSFELYPDFQTGGIIDVSGYKDGERGGKVRIRSVIEILDSKTLKISEIPYGTTTASLIDSILAANDKGKIKVKKVEDNTAQNVEILVHLAPGVSPELTVDALYAVSDCEVSISPNSCVIREGKPHFCGVSELLKVSVDRTVSLLERELQIERQDLENRLHHASLEKIFIENRVYRKIEESATWDEVIAAIHKGMKPYAAKMFRPITDDDAAKLTEIKIKRISKFDGERADEAIAKLEGQLAQVKHHQANLIEYAIEHYQGLLKEYGKGRERRTRIESFATIKQADVVIADQKLYVDRKEGFVGTGVKNGEFVAECSSLDEVLTIRRDGTFSVVKVADKAFVGADILYAGVFKRNDERCIYHLLYKDGKTGKVMGKRFTIMSISRDKEYELTKGHKGTKVLYLSVNPHGESEKVRMEFVSRTGLTFDPIVVDFGEMEIKDRKVAGQVLAEEPVKSVTRIERGQSTLAAQKLWFDKADGRLNTEGRGRLLGEFQADDKILVLYQTGALEISGCEPGHYYGSEVMAMQKFNPGAVVTAVYVDGNRQEVYAKRFPLEGITAGKRESFITDNKDSKLLLATMHKAPMVRVEFKKKRGQAEAVKQVLKLVEFAPVKGIKALGRSIGDGEIKNIELI